MTDQRQMFQSLSLKRRNLHEQIAEAMQEMVAENRLPRGSQLPPERELAQLLGVNRMTLREAITAGAARAVEMKAGSGTFVRETIPTAVMAECIERQVVFGNCSHEDLVSLREIIEPGCRPSPPGAPRRRTSRGCGRWPTKSPSLRPGGLEAQLGGGRQFPRCPGSRHPQRADLGHRRRTTEGHADWMLAESAIHIREGSLSHRRVYEAVAARDPVRAREAMEFHMRTTRRSQLGLAASRVPGRRENDTPQEESSPR